MLIVLPPSETKAQGGDGSPLDFDQLQFPTLNNVRRLVAEDLAALEVDEALRVLKISEAKAVEAKLNNELFTSPTMPALLRYTGVLFDALDANSIPRQAWEHMAIGSALFGVIGATDLIPHYRLSGGTKLPYAHGNQGDKPVVPTMKKRWGKTITEALTEVCESGELLIDLRSGTYQQLGPVPAAVTVRVESIQPDGTRKVVSHFNKFYKGKLARELALATAPGSIPESLDDVADIARLAGFEVELPSASQSLPSLPKPSARELTLVVDNKTA